MTDLHIYSALTEVESGHKKTRACYDTRVPGALVSRYIGTCLDIGTTFEDA